ncbi:hypothetical protein MHU86_14129 [Fragilaria crotonensis]|nr:hypothetical protein MHU86_14129 [Fragilaria crotonensis]
MSRSSRTRQKVVRKPTPRNATSLETIREHEDLVAAATAPLSSTLQDTSTTMTSKISTSQRQRQAKSVPAGTQVSVQVDFKAVFETLWNELGPRAKKRLTLNLGQLLQVTDTGRDGELAVIELCLSPAVCHPEPVAHATTVTLFLAILRDSHVEILRAIKALADNASSAVDSDVDMTGSDSSLEKSVHSVLSGNHSDATMGGSDESTSDVSMQDAPDLGPSQTRVKGRINARDY